MANYPGSLPAPDDMGATLGTNPHSALHDEVRDELVAIATELGTDPAGSFSTVKDRLSARLPQMSQFTRTSATTAASGTDVDIEWTVEVVDDIGFSTGSTLTVPAGGDGVYIVAYRGSVDITTGGSTQATVRLALNGDAVATVTRATFNGNGLARIGVALTLVEGDVLDFDLEEDSSAGSVTVDTNLVTLIKLAGV